MNKQQVIISAAAILLVVVLYQLPRVIMSPEEPTPTETHDMNISEEDNITMGYLKLQLKTEQNENYVNFADSLARLFLKYGVYDSAQQYAEVILEKERSLNALKKASEILYQVFIGSPTEEDAGRIAKQLKPVLDTLIMLKPNQLEFKNMMGMVLVTSTSPMAGIGMLREVLAADPKNRDALMNLGLLSIQSRQYERGLTRFKSILKNNPEDFEAILYTGICLMELDSVEKASNYFRIIVASGDSDPALKMAAQEYLVRN